MPHTLESDSQTLVLNLGSFESRLPPARLGKQKRNTRLQLLDATDRLQQVEWGAHLNDSLAQGTWSRDFASRPSLALCATLEPL